MIRYDLVCDRDHAFDGWFASSEAFDTQVRRGFVLCPVCQSKAVRRAIMAPQIARRDRDAAPAPATNEEVARPVALLSEKEQALRAMIKAFREHVVAHTDDVGQGFASEARRMHYGEKEHRPIRGVATMDEARDLHEEGIEVHPLPVPPDDAN